MGGGGGAWGITRDIRVSKGGIVGEETGKTEGKAMTAKEASGRRRATEDPPAEVQIDVAGGELPQDKGRRRG